MSQIIKLKEENRCLRERLKAIENIISGGVVLVGGASERKADKKEPTQRERINNYAEVLNLKNQKPKHLRK